MNIEAAKFIVTDIPQRKKPVLLVKTGPASATLVATFRNKECAELFYKAYNDELGEVFEIGFEIGERE